MTRPYTVVLAILMSLAPQPASAQVLPGAASQPPTPSPHRQEEAVPEQPAPPADLPRITDADRTAAFPDVEGHATRDNALHTFLLFDQLEWLAAGDAADLNWDSKGWVGRDRDRVWFRSEGERAGDSVAHAEAQVFYGRAVSRWWDVVAGVRQDVRPGPARTWAAIGVQGLAPYWFEVEATAYVGAAGRTHVRLETEYELLLTNRVIVQPLIEVEIYGKSDPARGLGAGLGSVDAGLRLRYEFRREFAPYVGMVWNRTYFGTADYARKAGGRTSDARLALGLRLWM